MKSRLLLFLCFSCKILVGQDIKPDANRVLDHINYLASYKMKGRERAVKRMPKRPNTYQQYKKTEFNTFGHKGFRQPFTAKVRRVVVPDSVREANNVIGFLDNGAPYTIIIGHIMTI